jgi:ubiquinone biosynthesis protein
MLQKTMVVVEGVARKLDPRLNMWATAEPVVGGWIADNLGPRGRIEDFARGVAGIARLIGDSPERLERLARWLDALEAGESSKTTPARPGDRLGSFALTTLALILLYILARTLLHI